MASITSPSRRSKSRRSRRAVRSTISPWESRSMAEASMNAARLPTLTTNPVTGGYRSPSAMRATTSTSLPISAPAWLQTGRPMRPARETIASRTARVARMRLERSSRRARKRGAPGSGGRRAMAVTFLGRGSELTPSPRARRHAPSGAERSRQRRCEEPGRDLVREGRRGGQGLLGGSPGCTASPPPTSSSVSVATTHGTGRNCGLGPRKRLRLGRYPRAAQPAPGRVARVEEGRWSPSTR